MGLGQLHVARVLLAQVVELVLVEASVLEVVRSNLGERIEAVNFKADIPLFLPLIVISSTARTFAVSSGRSHSKYFFLY